MSRPPYDTYPPHHPHHGRPYIVVHDNDVLSGRGVNIAQHPGNERFRALVTTREDRSYCESFTTTEKRALAEEIIKHIMSLDPPGRFLKRPGRSQSSRGLNGPWEELSPKERIKKTCQALRDCNRQDRHGYAAQVDAPTDVKMSADERARSGLSLKEHAASVVAKANPTQVGASDLPPHMNMGQPNFDQGHAGHPDAPTFASRKRSNDAVSPSVEHAAEWLKKQRTDEPLVSMPMAPAPADPLLSSMSSQIHSTPTPHVAPVPVTATPPSTQQSNGHLTHPYPDHLAVSLHPTSPQMPPSPPSPASFHQDQEHPGATSAPGPAPYSPVVLHSQGDEEAGGEDMVPPSPQALEATHFNEQQAFPNHHQQQFDDQPFNQNDHHGNQTMDVLQSAVDAAAAAAMMHNSEHGNGLSLLAGDDVPHASLHISDL